MRKAIIGVVAVLLVLVICIIVRQTMQPKSYGNFKSEQEVKDIGQGWQNTKVMSQEDFVRTTSLRSTTESTHKISDADLDYLIGLLGQTSEWPGLRNPQILYAFTDLQDIPSTQEEKIYNAVVPLLKAKEYDRDLGNSRNTAVIVLQVLNDKRAVPHILPLLQDKYPYVVVSAKKTLAQLKYQS